VKFPRILGIEAVGVVEEAPAGEFRKGDIIASVMGGMGRQFDGGYAEYTCVPAIQAQVIKTELSWETLGAIPEMLHGMGLALQVSSHSKGRAFADPRRYDIGRTGCCCDCKHHGSTVVSTTRNPDRKELLRESGADQVFIDTVSIAEQVNEACPGGIDKVLELVGTTTLKDSLRCAKQGGIVCMTGMVGNKWSFDSFSPMEVIPTAVSLTTYAGESEDFMRMPLQGWWSRSRRAHCASRSARSSTLMKSWMRIAAWKKTKRVGRSWC
jgi:NADPH:quinone reductase-like Zn-dependent oxidoreductase